MSNARNPFNPERDPSRAYDAALQHMLGEHEHHDSLDAEMALEFEYAAAALDVAVAQSNPIDMPEGLLDRLKSQSFDPADQVESTDDDAHNAPIPFAQPESALPRGNWVPWFAAAASILIAAVAIFMPRSAPSIADIAQERLAMIEEATQNDLIQWSWTATEDQAVVGEVTGDLVWSDDLNKGYMRISGLEVNDPTQTQYQLWIFDATRPEGDLPQFGEGLLSQRPIDGGVFDINENGEVIIEIDAKLTVQQAAAFAVTVEPPGGVVVSDRSRVPLLALAPTS
ncbi:MAG: anti-sigma factor [Phycisphaerales bacterium]|nr:anti-sigma factor [Phycisphaerales bacterium]